MVLQAYQATHQITKKLRQFLFLKMAILHTNANIRGLMTSTILYSDEIIDRDARPGVGL